MKQVNRIFALFLCICIVFSGAMIYDTGSNSKSNSNAVYNISSTMSHGYKASTMTNTTTSNVSDTYYDKQWALNNDGTFTYEDNSSTNTPEEDYQFPDIAKLPDNNNWGPNRNRGRGFQMQKGSANLYQSKGFNQQNSITAVENIDIDAPEAWAVASNKGKQVIVAVIDTGADYTHEDLKNSIWTNTGEIVGDGIDNDNNGYIDDVYGWDFCNNQPFELDQESSEYEHGTHVSGIIAASLNKKGIVGVVGNSNVKLMMVKALGGSEGSGEVDSVVNAIEYAQKMGASICNLSFGTETYSKKLKQVIADSDMLFVCAAGNASRSNEGDNTDKLPVYPASYDLDNIISVANLTYNGTLDTTSDYGKKTVDIAAPGSDIISTLPEDSYGYMSGTSMAAPMVTAVAAMVYSDRNVKLTKVKEIILDSAVTLSDLKNKVATGGMLNAYNALTLDISSN